MADLVRTIVLCGLLSGTQPVTVMGLLLVMAGGVNSRVKGLAYLSGALLVETSILLFASLVLGNTVDTHSNVGRSFLLVRLGLGIVLLVAGLRLRKAPKSPQPEIPKSLQRLQGMGPGQAFVAGLVLADYQGPVIGSLAMASSSVSPAARLALVALYTLLASGIPFTLYITVLRSQRAMAKMNDVTGWVMHHRRQITSWFGIVLGTLLVGDAALSLIFR